MSINPGDGDNPKFWNPGLGLHGFRDGELYAGDDTFDNPLPYPSEKFPPTTVEEIHKNSDKDSSQLSQHHTLGPRHNQASPGDHIHDGGTSKGFSFTKFTNGGSPIWVSSGTQPSIGSGVASARYLKLGTLCFYHWELQFATDTTFGTGDWQIVLPFAARAADGESSNTFTGTVKGYNGSTGTNAVGAMWRATATKLEIVSHLGTASWGATAPFTWNANGNNHLNGSLIYETAT